MDAMSSVLSYNDLDLAPVLEDGIKGNEDEDRNGFKAKDGPLHEATFMKQFLYFLMMAIMNVGYDLTTFTFFQNNSSLISGCQLPQP